MTGRVTPGRRGSYGIDAPYAAAFLAILTVAEFVLAVMSGKVWTFLPFLFVLALYEKMFLDP